MEFALSLSKFNFTKVSTYVFRPSNNKTLLLRPYQNFYKSVKWFSTKRQPTLNNKIFKNVIKPINEAAFISPTPVPLSIIMRCCGFALAFVFGSFGVASVYRYESWCAERLRIARGYKQKVQSVSFREFFKKVVGRYPIGSDLFWVIAGINLAVFTAFRSRFNSTMVKYFFSTPYGSTPALTMLLSVFAHTQLFHLLINMYVLRDFTGPVINNYSMPFFLSLYLSGGIIGSLASLLVKAAKRSSVPSIGASGGICALLGAFSALYPDARVCVPIVVHMIPHSFPAGDCVNAIILVETLALILFSRRSPIDHAAHLGGLLFGRAFFYLTPWADMAVTNLWKQLRPSDK